MPYQSTWKDPCLSAHMGLCCTLALLKPIAVTRLEWEDNNMVFSPAEKGEAARPDWAHVFLSVLPTLPLNVLADEARIAAALRSAAATVMARYGASLRRAAVAEWEVRLRVPDGSGAWRLVVSSPTGVGLLHLVSVRCIT